MLTTQQSISYLSDCERSYRRLFGMKNSAEEFYTKAVGTIRDKLEGLKAEKVSAPLIIRIIYRRRALKRHKEEYERRISEATNVYDKLLTDIDSEAEIIRKLTAALPPECRNPVAVHIIQDIARTRRTDLTDACKIYMRIREDLLSSTDEKNKELRDRLIDLEQKYSETETRGKEDVEKK